MSKCNGGGCQFTPKVNTAATSSQCASTTNTAAPCQAPSYSRACLPGDPAASPLRIARQGRAEHLWTRSLTATLAAALAGATLLDVLFPAFSASGGACIKSVTLSVVPAIGDPFAIPVDIVGVAGVWDFTDSGPDWTERVAIPCEKMVLDIQTTTGRCTCDVACEGCLYPAAVGGLFMVRVRFPATTIPVGTFTLSVTGTHDASPPCCTMPVLLDEVRPVSGPYPAVQELS